MARPTLRRTHTSTLFLALALVGCGEAEPDGYEPDGLLECPRLDGVYRVGDPELLQLVADFVLPSDSSELYLTLEHRPNGTVIGKLRRPARLPLAQAELLAQRDPRRYHDWRQQVRILQGDEQLPIGVAYGESLAAKLGPFVSSTSEFFVSECNGGWWDAWPLRSLPARGGGASPRDVAVRFSANETGLLVRSNEASRNDTGFVFFGQGVNYNTYGASDWHRFLRVPADSIAFHIDPPALDPARSTEPAPEPTLLPRSESLRNLERHVRETIPAGVQLSILREVQFEPLAIAMPRDRMLVELSATFDGGEADDPFAVVLAGDPRVSEVDVRRREVIGARSYVLLRLTYKLVP